MNSMRVVIDMQGTQTESRFRGIGRYTMCFAQAVAKSRGKHEIVLALNGLFPDTIEPIRAAFEGLLPQENIRVWYAPGPVRNRQSENQARRETGELIREAFLASLKPDLIHITSYFEGYIDDAVTSIGRFDTKTPVSVTAFDLIPLVNPESYLDPDPQFSEYYRRKVAEFRRASGFLAISEFSQAELISNLQIPPRQTVEASLGLERDFRVMSEIEANEDEIRERLALRRPFILYTGGCDVRKNLARLVQAFASLRGELSKEYDLVFAGKMEWKDREEFKAVAQRAGLNVDQLRFTGYVDDKDLVRLYNICSLYVFPAWHEGFGLPALEAMACGAPVIGANSSSLPEVIGLHDALFDPYDVYAMSKKMYQALTDQRFQSQLRAHGLEQVERFSWDCTAITAINFWESRICNGEGHGHPETRKGKPSLAYVSPLPPERTGIADYSAELLPYLCGFYEIDVIISQAEVDDYRISDQLPRRSVEWFLENSGKYDRVLYHMGNSPFHAHILRLVQQIPGTIVLHDFYIGGLLDWIEQNSGARKIWNAALYESHGYGALDLKYRSPAKARDHYPANIDVLNEAAGIVVHSAYSIRLVGEWYDDFTRDNTYRIIPHLRSSDRKVQRDDARLRLGIKENEFLVCSFGFIAPTKLNHCLFGAWRRSALGADPSCTLVFVGEEADREYRNALVDAIDESGLSQRVRVTGYVDHDIFQLYLAAADMAVQLRGTTRGETSGTVLDCMVHGTPLILNAKGAMAEVSNSATWMLSAEFEEQDLVEALERLRWDERAREEMAWAAQEEIARRHAPEACAELYAEAIEHFHDASARGVRGVVDKVAKTYGHEMEDGELRRVAIEIDRAIPPGIRRPIVFLDVSATSRTDRRTGIERVAGALTKALLDRPPSEYRVEPVYLTNDGGPPHYRQAKDYTLELLELPSDMIEERAIEPRNGDVVICLDVAGEVLVNAEKQGLFEHVRAQGARVFSVVYDLLPVTRPDVFPPGNGAEFYGWLHAISSFDGAVAISQASATALARWLKCNRANDAKRRPFQIGWMHLGADIKSSGYTYGLPDNVDAVMSKLRERVTFIMVGTVEPRKGYLQVLRAFESLWNEEVDVNLVIVGGEGWQGMSEYQRRDIPETVERIRTNPEYGQRLIWLEGVSDEYLERIYQAGDVLIAASYDEGFGLPLIEAAQNRLPIIARDIAVFNEVAKECAYFFPDDERPTVLADALRDWLALYQRGQHPRSESMAWLTWGQCAEELLDVVSGRWGRCHRLCVDGSPEM